LLLLLLLLLLDLLVGPGPPHQPKQSADGGADGCTFSGIATDGPSDRSQRRTTKAAFEGAAPEGLLLRGRIPGRWWRHGHPRIRRVEAGLLHGPAVALALVRFLLLW